MSDPIVIRLSRRNLRLFLALSVVVAVILLAPQLVAQKAQEDFGDKFKVATDDGGVSIATSSDGKYVYIVGKRGLVVSDDYGKTGSWVQTLRMK